MPAALDAACHQQIEDALEADDPFELMDLIVDVALENPDREFAEICCIRLARHRNSTVRGNAIWGFGHLARRFGQLDVQRVKRLVDIGLHDRSEYVRGQARSASEDLATYLSWQFEMPEV